MNNNVEIFKSPMFGDLRCIQNEEGSPLFCLADVCKSLELRVNDVIKRTGCAPDNIGVSKEVIKQKTKIHKQNKKHNQQTTKNITTMETMTITISDRTQEMLNHLKAVKELFEAELKDTTESECLNTTEDFAYHLSTVIDDVLALQAYNIRTKIIS